MDSRQPEHRPGGGGGAEGHLKDHDDVPLPTLEKDNFTSDPATLLGSGFIEPDLGNYLKTRADSVAMSDTVSLSDSVQEFPQEFGRTYHAYRAGSYAFPNDTREQERLALQGRCIKKLLGDKLYFAPFSPEKPPLRVLDIATGLGDWVIEMGDEFPESTIIATDLSPIQPDEVPPNVYFYVEDSTDPWDFPHKFDYVHTRCTVGCWASFQTQIAEQAFAALEPGGWFESQEVDGNICCDDDSLDPDGPVASWFNDLVIASGLMNRPAILGATLKEVYERVGFVDVHEHRVKMPIGSWPKDKRLKSTGSMWKANLLEGLGGFSYQLFNRAFDRTATEIEVSLINVRQHLGDPRTHAYMPGFVVWGRKPYPGEVSGAAVQGELSGATSQRRTDTGEQKAGSETPS